MSSASVLLACDLIRCPSVTPYDAGCQAIIANRLVASGFQARHLRFHNVDNLILVRTPERCDAEVSKERTLVFVGHTDVVTPGALEGWRFDPFGGHIDNGMLYGRGAVDMKGAIAAFVTACERFVQEYKETPLRLIIALTSSEEEFSEHGMKRVAAYLEEEGEVWPYILIGEPSSQTRVGDMVRKGRRGSLSGVIVAEGKAGHVAYVSPSENVAHNTLAALNQIINKDWDRGDSTDVFPPASLQITHIESGSKGSAEATGNITPEKVVCRFNVRFPPHITVEYIQATVEDSLACHLKDARFHVEWTLSGMPFLSQEGLLSQAVRSTLGADVVFSTGGGTSDGRFLAKRGREIIELGLCSQTAHAVNECVNIQDISSLESAYGDIMRYFHKALSSSRE